MQGNLCSTTPSHKEKQGIVNIQYIDNGHQNQHTHIFVTIYGGVYRLVIKLCALFMSGSMVQVLAAPFVKKAAPDIDELIQAWRSAKEAEAAIASPDVPYPPVSHPQSRSSLHRDRPSASHTSQRSCSAMSNHHHIPSTCSLASSLPIPIGMPPSDLLSISPRGPCQDPYVASLTSLPSHHPSSPPSPHSDISSRSSLPPEYPDLPSLTMPVSIRRAYSSAALHAQCRVQMLSNEAEQAWQDPSAAGALMHYPHEDIEHEPEAVHSETRKMARELQSSRAHFMHNGEHLHVQHGTFYTGLSHAILEDDLAPLPEEPGEESCSRELHGSIRSAECCSQDRERTELESHMSVGPLVIGSAPANFALLQESGSMSPGESREADSLVAAAAAAAGGSHSSGWTCPGALAGSPSVQPLRISGRGDRSPFGAGSLHYGNASAPESVLIGQPPDSEPLSVTFRRSQDHAALSGTTSTASPVGSMLASNQGGSPLMHVLTPPPTPTHAALALLGSEGGPASAGVSPLGRGMANEKGDRGSEDVVLTHGISLEQSPSYSGRKQASYAVEVSPESVTRCCGQPAMQMEASSEPMAWSPSSKGHSPTEGQLCMAHPLTLESKDIPSSHSCPPSLSPCSSTDKETLSRSGTFSDNPQAASTIPARDCKNVASAIIPDPTCQPARKARPTQPSKMPRTAVGQSPWSSGSEEPGLSMFSAPVPRSISIDETLDSSIPCARPSKSLSVDQRTSIDSFRILQSLLQDRGR
jgi:hypothetical protein